MLYYVMDTAVGGILLSSKCDIVRYMVHNMV